MLKLIHETFEGSDLAGIELPQVKPSDMRRILLVLTGAFSLLALIRF